MGFVPEQVRDPEGTVVAVTGDPDDPGVSLVLAQHDVQCSLDVDLLVGRPSLQGHRQVVHARPQVVGEQAPEGGLVGGSRDGHEPTHEVLPVATYVGQLRGLVVDEGLAVARGPEEHGERHLGRLGHPAHQGDGL